MSERRTFFAWRPRFCAHCGRLVWLQRAKHLAPRNEFDIDVAHEYCGTRTLGGWR